MKYQFCNNNCIKFYLTFLISLFVVYGCGKYAVYVVTIEGANKYATGTWQCTEPGTWWEKYVIKQDGTYKYYSAYPGAGEWSYDDDHDGTWKAAKQRSSYDGSEYVCILLSANRYGLSELKFIDSNTLEKPLFLSETCILERTDRNPWGK